jgi:tetrahydromethanopterin S-methyltransferase subunit E
VSDFLDHFPVVTLAFVLIVVVGAIKSVLGDLDYAEFVNTVKDVGLGAGAIGAARGLTKISR